MISNQTWALHTETRDLQRSHLHVFTTFLVLYKACWQSSEAASDFDVKVLNTNLRFLTSWKLAAHFKRKLIFKQNEGFYCMVFDSSVYTCKHDKLSASVWSLWTYGICLSTLSKRRLAQYGTLWIRYFYQHIGFLRSGYGFFKHMIISDKAKVRCCCFLLFLLFFYVVNVLSDTCKVDLKPGTRIHVCNFRESKWEIIMRSEIIKAGK